MRVAVYFAPAPAHPLWASGCAWLGRDLDGIGASNGPARPEVAQPWRYGFHATLKAPMPLAAGRDEAGFALAMAEVAARHPAFELPALQVALLAGFVALRPIAPLGPAHALRRLADDCVRALDGWRAPPDEAALARQRRAAASARQRAQVEAFGYAHVFDDWRFHLTLSCVFTEAQVPVREALVQAARRHFAAALTAPLVCDALSLFVEPAPGRPFELHQRVRLGVNGP